MQLDDAVAVGVLLLLLVVAHVVVVINEGDDCLRLCELVAVIAVALYIVVVDDVSGDDTHDGEHALACFKFV